MSIKFQPSHRNERTSRPGRPARRNGRQRTHACYNCVRIYVGEHEDDGGHFGKSSCGGHGPIVHRSNATREERTRFMQEVSCLECRRRVSGYEKLKGKV